MVVYSTADGPEWDPFNFGPEAEAWSGTAASAGGSERGVEAGAAAAGAAADPDPAYADEAEWDPFSVGPGAVTPPAREAHGGRSGTWKATPVAVDPGSPAATADPMALANDGNEWAEYQEYSEEDERRVIQHLEILRAGKELAASDDDSPRGVDASLEAREAEAYRLTQALALAADAEDTEKVKELLGKRYDFYRQGGHFRRALKDAEMCADIAWRDWMLDAHTLFRLGVARLEAGGRDKAALKDLRWARHLSPELPQVRDWVRRAKHWSSLPARPNHYRELCVEADAPADRVRAAYRLQALRWHPDKEGGDAARFRAVQEAWEVLGDQDRRHAYDFGARPQAGRRQRAWEGQAYPVMSPYVHVNANRPFSDRPEHPDHDSNPWDRGGRVSYST